MEQRPRRVGDLVDDYCPRERRLTNHAIVAIVEDNIRQTRCTTCDAEHPYKQGREPRRRKKEGTPGEAIVDDLPLADVAGGQLVQPPLAAAAPVPAPPAVIAAPAVVTPAPAAVASPVSDAPPARDDSWPAHRQLIRATLPRAENEPPPARPIPEFTMHQRSARGGHAFRHGHSYDRNGEVNGNVLGNVNGNGQGRPHGRPGHGNGNGHDPQGRPHGEGRRRRRRRR